MGNRGVTQLSKILGALTLPILLFQNCGNVHFNITEDSFASLEADLSKNAATYVETELNTPVDFALTKPAHAIAIADIRVQSASNGKAVKGHFVARSLGELAMSYTPKLGFRGRERVIVTAVDKYGVESSPYEVIVVVGNPLRDLEPALAVRGMGCVQCHSAVTSNVITDFGFGGDNKGHDYYFGQGLGNLSWQNGNFYGDHGQSFKTLNMPSDKSLIVPKAALPAKVASDTGLATLADYLKGRLAASGYETSRSTSVVEKASITIAAPTDEQLQAKFDWKDGDRLKFFADSEDSPELAGLKDLGHVFTNEGVLKCEGDLALVGPVYFENLHIESREGCRLYVMGSVFISGPITFDNSDDDRNLQITATRSINLGLGEAMKNGVACDDGILERYNGGTANGLNSLRLRYVNFWTVPSQVVRQDLDARHFGSSVVAEAELVQAEIGRKIWDASCEATGREVAFKHVLFNAPAVHNRYIGDVIGTVIAEYALMSLGKFKFQFDPVFRRVPILPFLDLKTYLAVEN